MNGLGLRRTERYAGAGGHGPSAAYVLALAVGLALALAVPVQAQEQAPAADSGAPAGASEPAPPEQSAGEPSAAGEGELTIRADRDRITVGQRVTFTGRRRPERSGQVVELQYRPAGAIFRTVAETEANRDGMYEVGARPRRSGAFRAVSPGPGGTLRSESVDVAVRASLTLDARRNQLRARGVKVTGELRPRDAGRRIVIQRRTGKGWETLAATRTGDAGGFHTRFEPPRLGAYRLRARVGGNRANLGDRAALGHPVYVYREDQASYYGPGFFGNQTACGQTLREDTVGVAHKTLPCGTRVRFHYRGRTRRVEVIDRGPFIEGRRWDLTEGARSELRFPRGVDEIWADR